MIPFARIRFLPPAPGAVELLAPFASAAILKSPPQFGEPAVALVFYANC